MARFRQYQDFQDIQLDAACYVGIDRSWAQYDASWHDAYPDTIQNVDALGRRLTIGEHSAHGLSSIQRFVGGPDHSPFTANPFHSGLKKVESNGGLLYSGPYDNDVPECYTRHSSPADTNSSQWTINHSEYASDHTARCSLSSNSDYSPSQMSCTGFDPMAIHPAHFVGGGGVSLSTIQPYDPDESQAIAETYPTPETSQDIHPCETDHIYVRPRVDSGCAQSECDEKPAASELDDVEQDEAVYDEDGSDTEYKPNGRASTRSKRPRSRSSLSTSGSSPKGIKRQARRGRRSAGAVISGRVEKSKSQNEKTTAAETQRPFPCPFARYNCPSTFSSKNEWKRHVSTQHIKLGFWRCDMCTQTGGDPDTQAAPNDFNRKDLFTQHLRRMHANLDARGRPQKGVPPPSTSSSAKQRSASLTDAIPEAVVAEHQTRCYVELRSSPPRASCLFCPKQFTGPKGWQEHMDHLGTHFERDSKVARSGVDMTDVDSWKKDAVLEDWLLKEGLVARDEDGQWMMGDGIPLRA